METGTDKFAASRGKPEYDWHEAADLCAGIVPGRSFGQSQKQDDNAREQSALRAAWRKRLLEEAAKELGMVVKQHPAKAKYGINPITGESYKQRTLEPWTECGGFKHADLVAWLDSKGLRPAFFFPESGRATLVKAGEFWVSDELALMNKAAEKFWKPADPTESDTHPANPTVAAWLNAQGMSAPKAKTAASYVRPKWAQRGRPADTK